MQPNKTASIRPPRSRRRHIGRVLLITVAAMSLLLAASLIGYQRYVAQAKPAVKTATVVLGDIEKTVTALGSLQPKDFVDVGAQVSGQLKTVYVAIGDSVEQNQLLAEVDPAVYESKVAADQAKLLELQAQRAQAQAELELSQLQDARNQRLYKTKAVSEDALQTGQAAVKIAAAKIDALAAQIDQARSTLEGDQASLGYTRIYAPMSGTVVSLDATTGQTLNASQTSPTLLRIADLDTMTVAAQVAEADVVKLKPGMAVYFTTLGMPEQRWQSAVRQILPTPELVNDVVLYNVLIDVANTDRLLMTDMTAQVFFIQGQASQVPLVPVAALHAGPNSGADGSYRVRVAGGDKAEGRTVQIGLMNRTSAEVVSGLKAGDEVITGMDNPAGRGDAGGQREGSGSRRQGGGGMRMRL